MSEYICDFENGRDGWYEQREEIVRCRDCKWFDTHTEPNLCYRLDNGEPVEPDGFCALAVRRDG